MAGPLTLALHALTTSTRVFFLAAVTSVLEPLFSGAATGGRLTFKGFTTDGKPLSPRPRTRRLQVWRRPVRLCVGRRAEG